MLSLLTLILWIISGIICTFVLFAIVWACMYSQPGTKHKITPSMLALKKYIKAEQNSTVQPKFTQASHNLNQNEPLSSWLNLEMLQELEWKALEDISCLLLSALGQPTIHITRYNGKNGGKDLLTNSSGREILVQCTTRQQTGLKDLREFLGVITAEKKEDYTWLRVTLQMRHEHLLLKIILPYITDQIL